MTDFSRRLAALLVVLTTAACSNKPTSTASGQAPASQAPAAGQTAPAASTGQANAPASAPATDVAAAPPAANQFTGAIAESMNGSSYTYARLTHDGREVWIAAPEFDAKVGETVTVALDLPMQDFESKTLKRTFAMLYFVQEVARNGQPLSGAGSSAASAGAPAGAPAPAMATGHGAARETPQVQKIAPPAGGLSVADVFARKATLSGKAVTVRGTVVKYNGGILDRNWLHIQDGSGSADAHDNDLTITTDAQVKVGDVVTMTGTLGTKKDFGAGYAYDAIVEKAALVK